MKFLDEQLFERSGFGEWVLQVVSCEPRRCSTKVGHYSSTLHLDTPCGVVEVHVEEVGHAGVAEGELQEPGLLNTLVCHLAGDIFEVNRNRCHIKQLIFDVFTEEWLSNVVIRARVKVNVYAGAVSIR